MKRTKDRQQLNLDTFMALPPQNKRQTMANIIYFTPLVREGSRKPLMIPAKTNESVRFLFQCCLTFFCNLLWIRLPF